jgi:hypothetical protein
MDEAKSARSRRVGLVRGVCGVARLGRSTRYVLRRAPCTRSLAKPTRFAWNTQTGSEGRSSWLARFSTHLSSSGQNSAKYPRLRLTDCTLLPDAE